MPSCSVTTLARYTPAGASTLSSAVAALAQVFAHVQVIPCADEGFSGEDNYLAVASNGPLDLAGAVPFGPEFHGPVLRD